MDSNRLMADPQSDIQRSLLQKKFFEAPNGHQDRKGPIIFLTLIASSATQRFPDHLSDRSVKGSLFHSF
ncbi:hypothetical protein [Desulfoplanes sp.]